MKKSKNSTLQKNFKNIHTKKKTKESPQNANNPPPPKKSKYEDDFQFVYCTVNLHRSRNTILNNIEEYINTKTKYIVIKKWTFYFLNSSDYLIKVQTMNVGLIINKYSVWVIWNWTTNNCLALFLSVYSYVAQSNALSKEFNVTAKSTYSLLSSFYLKSTRFYKWEVFTCFTCKLHLLKTTFNKKIFLFMIISMKNQIRKKPMYFERYDLPTYNGGGIFIWAKH